MIKDKPISSQQLAFLVFLLPIGSALVYIPGQVAGQDAWIAAILGVIPGLYVLYSIFYINSLFPDQRITGVSTKLLGKIPGTILNILFLWGVLLITLGYIFDISILLRIIYPDFPRTLIEALTILTGIYCLYQGINNMGRLGELFIGPTIFFIIIGLSITIPLANPSNLTPVLGAWKPLIAATLYSADWPFDEVVIWGLFLPLVFGLKENKKKIFQWYLAAALCLLIIYIEVVSILGPELIRLFRFPLYQVVQQAGFGEFKRIELIFLILWFITAFASIVIYFQGINFILQDVFSLQDYKALILPVGLLLVILSPIMFPSDIDYSQLGVKYFPVYTFMINLVYPTVILTASKIHQKRAG